MIISTQINDNIHLKKSEIILFIMDYLKNEHLDKTLISLEQETSLSLFNYNPEVTFLRKLIIDGQWKEVEEFFQPLSKNHNFPYKTALYEIRKQKFLEDVETEPENNNEVDNLVKQLKEIQKLCPPEEFNKLLSCLSTTPSITDQEEYKNWNSISGRLACFEKVRKLLDIIYPIKEDEYVNDNKLLIKVIECIYYLTQSSENKIIDSKGNVFLIQMLKKFINEIEKDAQENQLKTNFVYDTDYGGQNLNAENNLLRSTRNEMIISQSIQVNRIDDIDKKEQCIANTNTIVSNTNQYNNTNEPNEILNTESKQLNINYEDFIQSTNYYIKYHNNIDCSSLSQIKTITDPNIIRTCCFSRNGEYLSIGTNSKSVKIFSLQSTLDDCLSHRAFSTSPLPLLLEQKNHHQGSIYCMDWSVSGRLLASGSNDKTIKIMVIPDLESPSTDDDILELPIYGHKGTIRSLVFDPSSDLVLFSAGIIDKTVKIWDTENGKLKGELIGHIGDIHSLKWSNDGSLFASGGSDKIIRFWDLRTNTTNSFIDAKGFDSISDCSIHTNGTNTLIAIGHADGKVTIWDYYSKKIIKEIKNCLLGQEVRSVEFSPDGRFLVTGAFDAKVRIFDRENDFGLIGKVEHGDKVVSSKWHPFLPILSSTSSDKTARLWIPDKY